MKRLIIGIIVCLVSLIGTSIYSSALVLCTGGRSPHIEYDCNGCKRGETCEDLFWQPVVMDADNDGYKSVYFDGGDDCNDYDNRIHPGAEEICDQLDNNCSGAVDDVDFDGDGYIDEACGGNDCNDDNSDINPGQQEICTDGIDNDCDTRIDCNDGDCENDPDCPCDVDADGYLGEACGGNDCNDFDPNIHPGADDVCDGIDNDCDYQTDEDANCDDGKVCTDDYCVGGTCVNPIAADYCLINDDCYLSNQNNPSNECEFCEPTTSQSLWTPRPDGTSCGSGTCQGGVCQ